MPLKSVLELTTDVSNCRLKGVTKKWQLLSLLIYQTMANSLFRSHLLSLQTNLLNFAYVLTSNKEDAYDLLQDTTLKALDNEDRFSDNTNFKGWVFTIMRNIFINKYRRMMRSSTIIDNSEDLYLINVPQVTTPDTPESSVAVGEILKVLRSFPDDYRIPFSMHVSGYHYSEIAKKMNLPLGTVKSRIFYARKMLRERLGDYAPESQSPLRE